MPIIFGNVLGSQVLQAKRRRWGVQPKDAKSMAALGLGSEKDTGWAFVSSFA